MMVRFMLLTLAAGLRLNTDPVGWWEEHPVSTAEELQELLRSVIAEAGTVEPLLKAGKVKAQEVELREVVADMQQPKDLFDNFIETIWQSSSTKRCHQQLAQVMHNLTLTCEGLQPKTDWLLDYYAVPALPNKTCTESVRDIFASGDELVPILRVSRDAVASLSVSGKMLRRYQALSFLRNWLVSLTRTHHHALIWAGFWDGDPQMRTTKAKLSSFAKSTEHATMHPDSFLGQVIEASQDLDACYEDSQTSALAGNMWSIASMSFVLGMSEKAQGTVIALVNKKITGEHNLSQSVLSTHEIPTVGLAAWGLGYWSPKVIIVDLMGTCSQTSPALQKQLFMRLPAWAKSMKYWSAEAFVRRSRLQWQCIDCSGACSLDDALAEHVGKLVKAGVNLKGL